MELPERYRKKIDQELPPEDKAAKEAWDARAQAHQAAGETQAERLYKIYAGWSGQLHDWCASKLGRHVDCEFFPMDWKFKVYSGHAGSEVSLFGVPSMVRPAGEKSFTLRLPGPSDEPSDAELDKTFYNICLATARLLEIELGVKQLGGKKGRHGRTDRILPSPDSPNERRGPKALPPATPGIVDRPGSEAEDPPTSQTG